MSRARGARDRGVTTRSARPASPSGGFSRRRAEAGANPSRPRREGRTGRSYRAPDPPQEGIGTSARSIREADPAQAVFLAAFRSFRPPEAVQTAVRATLLRLRCLLPSRPRSRARPRFRRADAGRATGSAATKLAPVRIGGPGRGSSMPGAGAGPEKGAHTEMPATHPRLCAPARDLPLRWRRQRALLSTSGTSGSPCPPRRP